MEGQVESVSNGARIRISVCLKRLFSDLRARCYVTVPVDQHVRWLNRRLRKLFSLPRDTISLVCRGHLLPSDEPLTLLEPDDLVEVFPLQIEGNDVEKVPASDSSWKQNREKGSHEDVTEAIISPEQNAHSPGPSPSVPTLKSSTNVVMEVPEVRQDSHQLSGTNNLSIISHKSIHNDRETEVLNYKKFKSQQKRKRTEYLYEGTSEDLPSSLQRHSSRHIIITTPDINDSRNSESRQKRPRLNQSHGEARNILPTSPELSQTQEQLSECDASKLPKIRQHTTEHYMAETHDINATNNSESQQKQNREEHFYNEVSNTSHPHARPSASSSSSTPEHSADYYVSNLHERKRKTRQQSTNMNKKDHSNDLSILNNTTDSEFHREHKMMEYEHHKKKKQSHHEREKRRKKKQCELELTNEYGPGIQNLQNKCYNLNPDSSQKQSREMCLGDDMRKLVSPIPQLTQSSTILPQPTDLPEPLIKGQESQKLIDKCLLPSPNDPVQNKQYDTQDTVTSKLPDLNTSQNSFVEASEASPPAQPNTSTTITPPEPTANCDVSKLPEEKRDSRRVIDDFITPLLSPASKPQLKDGNEIKPESNTETPNIHVDKKAKSQRIRDQEWCISNDAPKMSSSISWRTASSEPLSSSKLEELYEVKQRALQLLDQFGADTISPAIQGPQRKRRRRVRRRRKPLMVDAFLTTPSTLPVSDQCDRSTPSVADQCHISTALVDNQWEISTVPEADQCERSTAMVVEKQASNSPTASLSERRHCEMASPPKAVIRNSSVGVRAPRVVRSLSPVTIDNVDEQSVDRPPVWLKKVNFV